MLKFRQFGKSNRI